MRRIKTRLERAMLASFICPSDCTFTNIKGEQSKRTFTVIELKECKMSALYNALSNSHNGMKKFAYVM